MEKIHRYLFKHQHIAPLALFRVLFGGIMFISMLRFLFKGWVHDLYVVPKFYFTYFGFEWVQPLNEWGMYVLFGVTALSFLMVMLGWHYRLFIASAFLSFTYIELIDKTNYLNHYYFISIVCFLLIFLPANRYFSIDVWRSPEKKLKLVPLWTIAVLKLQLGLVYVYAGIAKLNYDWLIEAMPLKLWLPAHMDIPIIGTLFEYTWVAYLFCWFGAFYDLTIPFFLSFKRTRNVAYFFVIVFHIATAVLFQIGMFPYIMILATLIFFPAEFHQNLIQKIAKWLPSARQEKATPSFPIASNKIISSKHMLLFFSIFFLLQFTIPLRSLLYPGKLFWTEEGYRFSWRVMLMEKAGYAIFHVKDPETGRNWEASNYEYLTPNQEKMMATQPDMILQFAHFLKKEYQEMGIQNPEIRVKSYVSLNGERSQLLIDPSVDLTQIQESFAHKDWILPFRNTTR